MASGNARQGRRLTATVTDVEVVHQRALLVGVALGSADTEEAEASLEELARLTETSGSDPIDVVLVKRDAPDPATFVGKGKVDELAAISKGLDIDVVVFDNSLSPAQQRNLQRAFDCDVVDRQAVILDIFAQHATTREGMAQVEMALLQYLLPRLRGKGKELSQQGFGVLARGPGETKLETDRRRIVTRIARLREDLTAMARTRDTQRKARKRTDLPQVALVGYTNAGKSTLLNRLTDAGVLTEDRLFSTLDSTVRRHDLEDGPTVLLADTVGFVRRLPHDLVEAFRSTLAEVSGADLLLHVVDGSDHDAETELATVRQVLDEIGAGEIPELIVINKADVATPGQLQRMRSLHPEAAVISAVTGEGTSQLEAAITKALADRSDEVELRIPYDRGDVLASVHRVGEVLVEEHEGDGTKVRARLPRSIAPQYVRYQVS